MIEIRNKLYLIYKLESNNSFNFLLFTFFCSYIINKFRRVSVDELLQIHALLEPKLLLIQLMLPIVQNI